MLRRLGLVAAVWYALKFTRVGLILRAVGEAYPVDTENQVDAVTALSGSGPAYFFLLMEAMADAGVKLGLEPDMASKLANGTALGAGQCPPPGGAAGSGSH